MRNRRYCALTDQGAPPNISTNSVGWSNSPLSFFLSENLFFVVWPQGDTGLGKKRGGNTEGAEKRFWHNSIFSLVNADYEKAFLYVALKSFLSDTDEQAQTVTNRKCFGKTESVLAKKKVFW